MPFTLPPDPFPSNDPPHNPDHDGHYYTVINGASPLPGFEWAPGVEDYMTAYINTVNAMCTTAGLMTRSGQKVLDAMFEELVVLIGACYDPHRVVFEVASRVFSEVLTGHTNQIEHDMTHGGITPQTMLRWARTALSHINTLMRLDRDLALIYGTSLTNTVETETDPL